jgi:3D (Asp-Asp-Asp) domain-containing protein
MTTLFKHLKSFKSLFKPRKLTGYILLASFCVSLTAPSALTVLAQDRETGNYQALTFGAFVSPSNFGAQSFIEERNLVLQNSLFIQPICMSIEDCKAIENKQIKVNKKNLIKKILVTAYSSTSDQTDSSPFITANGTYVYDGVVACNFLPFGTKVKFPELYGDKIFTVQDRMAKKNSHKIDIWMVSRTVALQFGVKRLTVEVVD